MPSYPYLVSRKGHYYFRIAVPKPLVSTIGMTELFYSLRTKNLTEARARCLPLLDISQRLFKQADISRSMVINDLRDCLAQLTLKYSLNIPALAPAPLMISDTGLPRMELGKDHGEPISIVFEEYLAECSKDRTKTLQTKRAILKLWLEIIGDTPVKVIGKAQAREFKQVVMKLPSNLNKRFKGKPIKEIDLDSIPADQRLSIKSVNINLGIMGSFVNWMVRNGYYEAANPFSGLNLKDSERAVEKRHPFSQKQLEAIFSCPIYTGCKSEKMHDRYIKGNLIIKDGLYWVPLIALYSGARLQEICQLYVSDVKQVGDIWVFDFNDAGDDKLIKTSSSTRKTPIHPKLIELGLLEHRKTQIKNNQQRLLSDLPKAKDGTYSSVFSKRFNHFLERFEIKTNKTSFHSFRHTFIDELRNTETPKEVREALVGHLSARTAHDNYGSAMGMKRLFEGLSKVAYEI